MTDARAVMDGKCSEAAFQAAVIQLAAALGWHMQYHWSERHSPAGWPDVTLWRLPRDGKPARFMLVELKREKGRLTAEQRRIIEELRQCGLTVHVWRPSDWGAVEEALR